MHPPTFSGGSREALQWAIILGILVLFSWLSTTLGERLQGQAIAWWGHAIDWRGEMETLKPVGKGMGYLLLPARWGGHRRWRQHHSRGRVLPTWATWLEDQSREACHEVLWRPTPHALTIVPPATFGAGSPARSPERVHRRVRARFPQGRWWSARVQDGQPWAVFQVQLAAIMRRSVDDFSVYHNGIRVVQADIMPTDVQEVDLRQVHRPRQQRQVLQEQDGQPPRPQGDDQDPAAPQEEPRQRSRSRTQQRPWARPRLARDAPGVQEDDNIYLEMPTAHGCYRVELRLEDLSSADTWHEVCVHDLEWALHRTYPQLFSRYGRIAIAANMVCLRDEEYVAPWIARDAAFTLIPNALMGAVKGGCRQEHLHGPQGRVKNEKNECPPVAQPTRVQSSDTRSTVSCQWTTYWLQQWKGQVAPPADGICPALLCKGVNSMVVRLRVEPGVSVGALEHLAQ